MAKRSIKAKGQQLLERAEQALTVLLEATDSIDRRDDTPEGVFGFRVAGDNYACLVEFDLNQHKWSCECAQYQQVSAHLGHCQHTFMVMITLLRQQEISEDLESGEALRLAADIVKDRLMSQYEDAMEATHELDETIFSSPTFPTGEITLNQEDTVSAIKRVRIYQYMTRSTFLHIEDSLGIGKVRLFAGTYHRGQKADKLVHHFIDVADLRVLLQTLTSGVAEYQYQEFKGTPLGNGRAVSRVLKVKVKEGRVFVEFTRGPGKRTQTGAITPQRTSDPEIPQVQVTVAFDQHQIQRLAQEVLAYLHAWDVCRMMTQRTPGIHFPLYETTHLLGKLGPTNGAVAQGAVSGDDIQERITALYGPEMHDPNGSLHYRDATAVDPTNAKERAAFLKYVQQQGYAPDSRQNLRHWLTSKAS